jgi:hypothetical protein
MPNMLMDRDSENTYKFTQKRELLSNLGGCPKVAFEPTFFSKCAPGNEYFIIIA